MKTNFTKAVFMAGLMGATFQLSAQTTATDFNINDCSGKNQHLFAELEAGKVVVISFVMPCHSCVGPTLTAYNEVKTYAASHPGRVLFYLADDDGKSSCSTMNTWANTNGITGVPIFSNAAATQNGYGTAGMPKIVVLGGSNHGILLNQNSGVTATSVGNAIDKGLTLTGINKTPSLNFSLSLYPNPATSNRATLNYVLPEAGNVSIEVYNTVGALVKELTLENQAVGQHEVRLELDELNDGIYFLKLNASNSSQTIQCIINK
jgi:hypothetical protein